VDDGCPLQLVIAAVHAAPDPEWLAVVDLVAVMLIIGVVLARQAITGGVCSGKLEQRPDLTIGLPLETCSTMRWRPVTWLVT
jgi:hypothetical protein